MDKELIYKSVKSAFCELIDFKDRESSLEIITPFSTINDKFISIFITEREDKFIISDGGWINQNVYNEIEPDEINEDVLKRIFFSYETFYKIKTIKDAHDQDVYYKTCDNHKQIANCAFDMGNFIAAIVNSKEIPYRDVNDIKERVKFKRYVDDYLRSFYREKTELRFRQPLDIKSIKFNAVLTRHNNIYLFNYVTGTTIGYFENDLRKNIVSFEVIEKSNLIQNIKGKFSILNNEAEGYQPLKSDILLQTLNEKTTTPYFLWDDREKIHEFIK